MIQNEWNTIQADRRAGIVEFRVAPAVTVAVEGDESVSVRLPFLPDPDRNFIQPDQAAVVLTIRFALAYPDNIVHVLCVQQVPRVAHLRQEMSILVVARVALGMRLAVKVIA